MDHRISWHTPGVPEPILPPLRTAVKCLILLGEPGGTRTHDHLIKSQVLYHLSYGLSPNGRCLRGVSIALAAARTIGLLRAYARVPSGPACIGSPAIPHHRNALNPTNRRMSSGVAPPLRNSRRPVAEVDLDSLRPSASRTRRW